MIGSVDVDGFQICIQDCVLQGFRPLKMLPLNSLNIFSEKSIVHIVENHMSYHDIMLILKYIKCSSSGNGLKIRIS